MASYKSSILERVEFHVPAIASAPLVFDDWSLAFRLGFRGKTLWAIANRKAKLYKIFQMKKASGGTRTIHAPTDMMKLFLTQLRTRILLPLVQLLGPHVGAYQLGKSTKDSATFHVQPCDTCAPADGTHTCTETVVPGGDSYSVVRQKQDECVACVPVPEHQCPRSGVKIHMDLKDFFGSTRRAWIRHYFHDVVGYNHYVSGLLAQLMTVAFQKHSGVPQGAPTSGDICNLVADWRLDRPVLEMLSSTGWVYSRYADDLYFSHPLNLPREDVDAFVQQIDALIRESGYRMNWKKLHIQRPHRRQQLLGVVLNRKVNIPNDQYKRMKAIIFNCYRNGFEAEAVKKPGRTAGQLEVWIQGRLSYMGMINPRKTDRLKQLYKIAWQRHISLDRLENQREAV